MNYVWLNGSIVESSDAKISVFDHGLITGDGVFETIGVYKGIAFALDKHLARLQRSAEGIGLQDIDLKLISRGITELLRANEVSDGKIRVTVTGGESVLGSDRVGGPLTVVLATADRVNAIGSASVQVAPWPRNERSILSGLKTISYAENVAALAWAKERSADEVIFGNTRGNLCEGSGSNIFVVVNGRAYTPPLSSGALGGITRDLIVNELGVEEKDFPLDILYSSELEECFLASSVREVQHISRIDGKLISENPGPVTSRLRQEFTKLIEKEVMSYRS